VFFINDFKCLKCGECCRAGFVIHISKVDVEKWRKLNKYNILDHIKIKSLLQREAYRLVDKRSNSLSFDNVIKGMDNGLEYVFNLDFKGKCPFLELNLCSIHNYKPIGCINFPYIKKKCLSYDSD
jgi:Fe-S-cluster containining protein